VLLLADERMSLMPGVAAYKWEAKAPILDPERERAVTSRAVEVAGTMGLEPGGVQEVFDLQVRAAGGVQEVFDLQVRAARESQQRLHDTWRDKGFDFGGPIPSLEKEIRPRLDRFTVDFLRALYVALPELQRTDFTTAYVRSLDRLRAPGWTDRDKRDLLSALSKVRALESGSGALARVTATGVLRVGTTGDYAPFSIEKDGTLSGADVALAESLATKMGVTPVFVRTAWPSLIDDLRKNKFDVALGGISVTPARSEVGSFSMPYSSGGKAILSRCAETGHFSSLADVDRRGVRVIVNPGGTNEQYVRENIKRAKVLVFPDNTKIFDEISRRRADVMITDDVEVELQTRRHADLCRTSRETLTRADKAIFMARDPELVNRVNAALTESIQAGEPKRLLEQSLSAP